MTSLWKVHETDRIAVNALSEGLGLSNTIASVLVNRGIVSLEDASKFLKPRLADLPDPFLLHDMDKGVERIIAAINSKEKIAIFGDYDTDGITSTALLYKFFSSLGVQTEYHLPNRVADGYGINRRVIDKLKSSGVTLLITVDNGSSALDEITYAETLGIDSIVTDHHELPKDLPSPVALINPKASPERPEFLELAGVGVAFYLAAGIRKRLRETGSFSGKLPEIRDLLDLVAIGTIADVAPLKGINRTLVKNGIENLRMRPSTGVMALADAAGTDLTLLDASMIAFRISPRINAAGRLGDEMLALKLLLTDNVADAKALAAKLNSMNSDRQKMVKEMFTEAEEIMKDRSSDSMSFVAASSKWHMGVLGIVASKVAEKYSLPCALVSLNEEGTGRGSARSIGEFDIMKALTKCSAHLINFGGHRSAAGFDINAGQLEAFRTDFEAYAKEHLTEEDRSTVLHIDAELELKEMNEILLKELEALKPFGEGNPEPIFATKPCFADSAKIVGNDHLKLKLKSGTKTVDAIGFNQGSQKLDPQKRYKFAGLPEMNIWNGNRNIQFKISDIKE